MATESGLAGIIQGPPLDFSPIQQFGQQLIMARQRQQEADQHSLQTAIQIAEYDPQLAQQIGGKAMSRLYKDKGAGKSEDFFKAISHEAATKRSQQSQLFEQQLAQSKAATEASGAETLRSQALTQKTLTADIPETQANARMKNLQADTEARVSEAEKRLAQGGDYEGRVQDATMVAMGRGLSDPVFQRLTLTPDEAKQVNKDYLENQKALHAKVMLEKADELANKVIVDQKTGKSRPLTVDEINDAVAGKPVPGLSTAEIQQGVQRIAIEKINAQANMMRAVKEGKLSDVQVLEHFAKAEADLALAEQRRKQGIKTGYDDLLKTFSALREEKLAGGKPDPTLMKEVETQMAAYFGGKPDMYKDWLGNVKQRGFIFKDAGDEKPAAPTGLPEQSAGTRLGAFVRQAPGAAGTIAATAGQAAESQTLDFFTALTGGQAAPSTTTQDMTVGGQKVPAGSRIYRTITGTYYVTPDGKEIQQPGTPRPVPNP